MCTDVWPLVSLLGDELDDMLLKRDFVCGGCGLSNDQHYPNCEVCRLLYMRQRMVPMVV